MNDEYRRIDEEKVSIDSLVHCLKSQHGCLVKVNKEEDDPPDYWITVDNICYAAEVTSIVTEQGYHAKLKKLAHIIQKEAQNANSLSGTYVLSMRRIPTLPRFSTKSGFAIINDVCMYIRKTQYKESSNKYTIWKDLCGTLHIEKISNLGSSVEPVKIESEWVETAKYKLHELLQSAISEKIEKLLKKGITATNHRTILLLYDAFGFAESHIAQKELLTLDGYDWFHSIFWVASFNDCTNDLYPEEPGRNGVFLFSKDTAWWKKLN